MATAEGTEGTRARPEACEEPSRSPVPAWEDARRTAARLLEVGEQGGHSSDEAFWRPAAARYLAPLLMAAELEAASMGEVLSWIATGEQERPMRALSATHRPGAQAALGSHRRGAPPSRLESANRFARALESHAA